MRKHVVRATGVDVEPFAEERQRHRRAFDVPAWKSITPPAWPYLQAVLGRCLPQREVPGVPFAGVRVTAHPGEKFAGRVAREPAVAGKRGDVEIDIAVDHVGVPLGDEPLYELLHLDDVVGRVRISGRGAD